MDDGLTEYMGVGMHAWAREQTFKKAVQGVRDELGDETAKVVVYRCHPDAYVTNYGSISSPRGFKPERIDSVGD